MPDLTEFPTLDVAIGLAFMYFLLSVLCASVQELIASVLKLRARNLERAIRALVGDKNKAADIYRNWRIGALKTPRWLFTGSQPRNPSYIPSRTFALALIDTLAPPEPAHEDAETPQDDANVLRKAKNAVNGMSDETIGKPWLLNAIDRAEDNIDVLRGEIEDAFNTTMDRATGWYKRKVQVILLVIALVAATALNADTFNVAQRLFQDDALRAQVVGQALKATEQTEPLKPDAVTAKTIEDQIKQARASALPLGWSGENTPDGGDEGGIALKVGGIIATAFALTLGAPFWFDVLGRFAKLRSSGNRIGTPKDDDSAPVDRDDRPKSGMASRAPAPLSIADAERAKLAHAPQGARQTGAPRASL